MSTSFQEDGVPSGSSGVFLFFRCREDYNEAVIDLDVKCLAHHMAAPSSTRLEEQICSEVAKTYKIKIASLLSCVIVFVFTRSVFCYLV